MTQVQFNHANLPSSAALEMQTERALGGVVRRFVGRLTRLEVHFADANGSHKHGPGDKRCTIEARPSGMHPVAVEAVSTSYQGAARQAARKLRRALEHRLSRG